MRGWRWPRTTMAAARTPADEGAAWGGGEEGGAAWEDKQVAVEELQEAVSTMASHVLMKRGAATCSRIRLVVWHGQALVQ